MSKPVQMIRVNGKDYSPMAMRIISRNEDGTPDHVQFVHEQQACELSENPDENCFIVGFCPVIDYGEYAGKIPTI